MAAAVEPLKAGRVEGATTEVVLAASVMARRKGVGAKALARTGSGVAEARDRARMARAAAAVKAQASLVDSWEAAAMAAVAAEKVRGGEAERARASGGREAAGVARG